MSAVFASLRTNGTLRLTRTAGARSMSCFAATEARAYSTNTRSTVNPDMSKMPAVKALYGSLLKKFYTNTSPTQSKDPALRNLNCGFYRAYHPRNSHSIAHICYRTDLIFSTGTATKNLKLIQDILRSCGRVDPSNTEFASRHRIRYLSDVPKSLRQTRAERPSQLLSSGTGDLNYDSTI